jgi:toxin ParE1/3/4
MEVRFHRLAAREYRDARDWYRRRGAGLGTDFKVEVERNVERNVERIVANPARWPVFREGYRRVRLRRFPYAIYYHIEDLDHILVLAIAHHKRRPGYWLTRTRKP